MIRSCSWEPRPICVPAGVKQTIFGICFSTFELGGLAKTLNDWPLGKQRVLFHLDLIDDFGETKLTVLIVDHGHFSPFKVLSKIVRLVVLLCSFGEQVKPSVVAGL